jgi:hypothetical protein
MYISVGLECGSSGIGHMCLKFTQFHLEYEANNSLDDGVK